MNIRELQSESERRAAVSILSQLWTDRTAEEIRAWTAEDEYHLFGGYLEGDLVAVAGVLVEQLLHHSRHAWLYDFVVDEPRREHGYGTELLAYIEEWAGERNCDCLALASPLAKQETHQFYESRGYDKWGYIIEKEL